MCSSGSWEKRLFRSHQANTDKGMLRTDQASTSSLNQSSASPRRAADAAANRSAGGPALSRRKFGPQVASTLATMVIAGSASVHALGSIRNWLQNQPEFRFNSDQISIHPEPPQWLNDPRDRILALIPELTESISAQPPSALTFDTEELARRLRMKMTWIESVKSVRLQHPNHLELDLVFRKPVMALSLVKQGVILLDKQGVVLPATDVRKDFLDNIIQFNYAETLVDQVIQRGGKHPAQIAQGQVWEDSRIADSLQLAAFLTAQDDARNRPRRLFRLIDAANDPNRLIVRTVEDLWIWWGRAPGHELPGEPKADTKWRLLMEWLQLHGQSGKLDVNQSMLVFEKDRAVLSSAK